MVFYISTVQKEILNYILYDYTPVHFSTAIVSRYLGLIIKTINKSVYNFLTYYLYKLNYTTVYKIRTFVY